MNVIVKSGRIALTMVLIAAKPILRLKLWPAIFVVNAGSESDIKSYLPLWVLKVVPKHNLYAIGFYRISWACWALVLGTPASNEELDRDPELMAKVVNGVKRWKGRRIALTGILTAYAVKHRCWPDADGRFVLGSYGTPYLFRINIKELSRRFGKDVIEKTPVGVVGYGYTGKRVATYLRGIGYTVYGFDQLNDRDEGVHFMGSDFGRLQECGLIVLMTTCGDGGLDTIASHIQKGQVVLADTHPKPTSKGWATVTSRGGIAAECGALFSAGMFWPKLPRWGSKNTLGCSMQAIAEAATKTLADTQADFDVLADRVGIESMIEYPALSREAKG